MTEVTISIERFQQLIRAEHDANALKALIASTVDRYCSLSLDELRLLDEIYRGDVRE